MPDSAYMSGVTNVCCRFDGFVDQLQGVPEHLPGKMFKIEVLRRKRDFRYFEVKSMCYNASFFLKGGPPTPPGNSPLPTGSVQVVSVHVSQE